MPNENYTFRKSQLLKDLDTALVRVRSTLNTRFGEEQAGILIRESHKEYEALIPQIPFIGARSPFLIFLLPASRYLAVYRVMQRQGRTAAEAGQLIDAISAAELQAVPRLLRRAIGYLWFSPWFVDRLKKRAAESQQRRYPGGYVLTIVEGRGQDFDYGIDYTECAACKFLGAQNALELAPYLCAMDKTVSQTLGWGLTRSMTLAEGGEKCDFRFKKGGETRVALPEALQT